MNNGIALALLLTLLACGSPTNTPTKAGQDALKSKSLPVERWETATKGRITSYPPLARLAGIAGDVVMALTVNDQGQVIATKLLSGPPQLAAMVDSYARKLKFVPEPSDLPGPWSFSITARFDLTGQIGVAPTGQPIQLQPVATPQPSIPANFNTTNRS
jgi:TonB family protein